MVLFTQRSLLLASCRNPEAHTPLQNERETTHAQGRSEHLEKHTEHVYTILTLTLAKHGRFQPWRVTVTATSHFGMLKNSSHLK